MNFGSLFILLMISKEYVAIPTPLRLPGVTQTLTPFIKHWEPANFDRNALNEAHDNHIKQKHERRKRSFSPGEFGPFHTIRLNFSAHDREFRLILKQDPLSVFTNDVEIESTSGPVEYDISRVYSGTLEDDDQARVYAVLTKENLLDGTIETKSDHYYLEPALKYSKQLADSGIHSIVYKLSDIKSPNQAHINSAHLTENYCASEKLRNKMKNSKNRYRRWLPEDFLGSINKNPPLPLDLDVPYNDGVGIVAAESNETEKINIGNSYEKGLENDLIFRNSLPTRSNKNGNIVSQFNATNDSYELDINGPRLYTKHKNIIISTNKYNRTNSIQDQNDSEKYNPPVKNMLDDKNFTNTNWTKIFGNNGRPVHKTHVEIITKNGATKKPNLIVNNYNPELPSNSISTNFNHMSLNNWFVGRNLDFDFSHGSANHNSVKASYDRKITCMLYLQADHTFFQKMGSDEASIEAITRHVQRANAIYRNTDFNNDGKPDNITFMIKRIKVHNANAVKDPTYRFPGSYGVEKFLELFSEEDYDAFCLAYMFTYRDFEMGTLGLAWTGDLKNAGGVCEKNGHYRGSLKSLNTGIVTLLNYGKHVPPAVSHVTLAHEIGHNFGSPHDPVECTPGGEDGNFIMFARATSGDKKNNNKFSKCSLKSIEPVLNSKARSAKGCFTEPQVSICGNGVVEPGEECDCGWEEDCKDVCCFPMTRSPRLGEKPCTLSDQAMCSPSQGLCCTVDCKLKFGEKCRDDNGCRDPSFCDGRMPQCPPSVNKPNKTICNKEFVCYMGECTGSICLAYGLESCQCIPGPNEDKIKSCELCCKVPGEGNPCLSSFIWNEPPYDVPDMYAKPGTPCNDYNGYCDVYQKCREVDPSGPLATLRKILLSEESIATFKKWIEQNWYTIALSSVGLFALLVITTKLLSKRSNTKLKSVTIIHSATTETVRLPDDKNGVIVHTALRTKVPFKKKVRGERIKKRTANSASNNKTIQNKKSKNKSQKHKAGKLAEKVYSQNDIVQNDNKSPRQMSKSQPDQSIGKQLPSNKDQNVFINKTNSKKGKETIINYSNRNSRTVGLDESNNHQHINTLGRVQKWLLESPIVAQPLSHIEQSKVKSAIKKSLSTPERLVHEGPKKSKSLTYMPNEKVKMEVVYKPPFKFALRFNKKPSVKTNIVGGTASKRKRIGKTATHPTPVNNIQTKDLSKLKEKYVKPSVSSSVKQPQELVLNAPNYEGLALNLDNNLASTDSVKKKKDFVSREQQKLNLLNVMQTGESASSNLSRNFSSTQNLIQNSIQSRSNQFAKNRGSLNLKSNDSAKDMKNDFLQKSSKKSVSNSNLRRVSSDANANVSSNLKPSNSTPTANQLRSSKKLPLKNIHHSSSSSAFNNIPRANISNNSIASKGSAKENKNRRSLPMQNNNADSHIDLRLEEMDSNSSLTIRTQRRPNLFHQLSLPEAAVLSRPSHHQQNQYAKRISGELPSDLEIVVSDVENLVS